LRKQGVKPTGEEIAEADIRAAWEATEMLKGKALLRPVVPKAGEGTTVDWREAPVEPCEQLDLFVAA
jgi:hypothetical protein